MEYLGFRVSAFLLDYNTCIKIGTCQVVFVGNLLLVSNPHSTVIFREYFLNIPLKYCNIARILIKRLEKFMKYRWNLVMSV